MEHTKSLICLVHSQPLPPKATCTNLYGEKIPIDHAPFTILGREYLFYADGIDYRGSHEFDFTYQREFISITCLSTGAAKDPGHGTKIVRGSTKGTLL